MATQRSCKEVVQFPSRSITKRQTRITNSLLNGAQSPNSNEQIEVLVDGKEVGLFKPGEKYSTYETDGFTLASSGPHTVRFQGVDANGTTDSALISSVHIALAGDAEVLTGGVILNDGAFTDASANHLTSTQTPSPSPWVFSGNAGIPGPLSAAFVGTGGGVSQSVSGFQDDRTYTVAFDAAQSNGSSQTIQVLVDGNVVDTITPSDVDMRLQYSATFQPGAGTHTVSFRGIGGNGTANFTNVRVLATGFSSDGTAIADGSFDPSQGAWQLGQGTQIIANAAGMPIAPSGSNAASISGTSTLSQEIGNFQPGQPYEITFRAAQAPGSKQTINVLVDGTVVGTYTPGSTYGVYTTQVFSPDPGTHRITFEGATANGGAVLVNDVELALLPAGDSQMTTNTGQPMAVDVANQDELQRLQWASLAAAAQNDNQSTDGGDDLLGVVPNMTGISAVSAIAANPFVLGWKNGASSTSSVTVSADGTSVTKNVIESDGAAFTLAWANDHSPSEAGDVAQTFTQTSLAPTSQNGYLPLNGVLAAGGSATPAPPVQLSATSSASGSSNYTPPTASTKIPPYGPPNKTYPPPTNGYGGISFANAAAETFLSPWINEWYATSSSFRALWNAIVAAGTPITLALSDLSGLKAAGATGLDYTQGGSNDPIYLDISAAVDYLYNNGMKTWDDAKTEYTLYHELFHVYQDQQAMGYAMNTLGLSETNNTNTGAANEWTNAYENATLSDLLSPDQIKKLEAAGVPAFTLEYMPVNEYNSYYAAEKAGNVEAGEVPDGTGNPKGIITPAEMNLIGEALTAPPGELFAQTPPDPFGLPQEEFGDLEIAYANNPLLEDALQTARPNALKWDTAPAMTTAELKKLIENAKRIQAYEKAQGYAVSVTV